MAKLTEAGIKVIAWAEKNATTVKVLGGVAVAFAASVWLASKAINAVSTVMKVWTAATKVATAVQGALNVVMRMNPSAS